MDFTKLKNLIDSDIVIDVKGADVHDIRASNEPGNDNSWRSFTPELYSNEEELAAAINNVFKPNKPADDEIIAGYK